MESIITNISTFKIEWETGDEEKYGVECNEAGEEKIHGVPKSDCIPHLFDQNAESS